MTDAQMFYLAILGVVALSLFKRKKPPSPMVFFEVFEIRRESRKSRPFVNIVIIAFVVLMIVAAAHGHH